MEVESTPGTRTPTGRHPANVVALRTAQKAARSGVIWGYIFGLTVSSSALGYVSGYKTQAQREHFAALFGSNTGLAAINGPARGLQTVPGYTAWKSFMFLIIVGSVWGLLTSTRLLRGEEEAGRWELLLAGQTTRRRAAAQALVGLGVGLVALWTLTAIITVVIGQLSKVQIAAVPALFFALALVAGPAMFLALGALTSQLASTRRQAAGYAGAVLGACYALRLIADSRPGLEWLRWVTPIGWVEELRPLTSPHPLALLPVVALVLLVATLAIHMAGRRDLHAGVLPEPARAKPRSALLFGNVGLTIRLVRPAVLGWAAAISATALLMGFIAKQGGSALTSSSSVESVVSRFGPRGGSAEAYLGFTFLIVAVLVAFAGSGQVTAARGEETEGRLDHLLVRPTSRTSWLAGRLGVAATALIASGLLAGLFAWFGAASQNAGVGIGVLLQAGINLVAPALCLLGLGTLFMGIWPRATTFATYGLLVWSFLVELLGGFFSSNHWLLDTSVFHQVAAAPATGPDWTSAAGLLGVGIASALVGAVAFRRRDLASE
jgi:ABC-2 type transport system permease protein